MCRGLYPKSEGVRFFAKFFIELGTGKVRRLIIFSLGAAPRNLVVGSDCADTMIFHH